MSTPVRPNSLQTYQTILYSRALHPEFVNLKQRAVLRHPGYHLEAWVSPGGHVLRFERRGLIACELVTDREGELPGAGVVAVLPCAGEHDFEHRFTRERVTYMTTVQTETLAENIYASTYEELLAFSQELEGALHTWDDEAGRCLSLVGLHSYHREVHAESYHMQAYGRVVLRTQTIFEYL